MKTRSATIRAVTMNGKELIVLKDDDEMVKFGIDDACNRIVNTTRGKDDNQSTCKFNKETGSKDQLVSPVSSSVVSLQSDDSWVFDDNVLDEFSLTPPHSRTSSIVKTDRVGRPVSKPGSISRSSSVTSSRASSPRPKNYVCDFDDCTKAYSKPSLLEHHMRSVHYGYRPFKCTVDGCEETFTRKDHLARHILKHAEDKNKPFHCSVCGKGVSTLQQLKRHEKTHFKSFECTFENCSESFHKHQSLKAHIRSVHEGKVKIHRCQFCGKEFPRPGRLTDHIEKHHSQTSKLICDYPNCYKTFRVWSALQLHIKTDHPRLECEICHKKCVGPSGLANHMKIHNNLTVIKLWKCLECSLKFQKKEDVVKHYAEKHPLVELPEELRYDVKDEKVEKENKGKQPVKPIEYYIQKKEEEKKRKRLEREKELQRQDADNSSDTTLSDLGFMVSKPTMNRFTKHENSRVTSSPDVLSLIVDNVDQRLECPYTNCHRLFRKQYDLTRHLAWHTKQDEALESRVESILSELENGESDSQDKPEGLIHL